MPAQNTFSYSRVKEVFTGFSAVPLALVKKFRCLLTQYHEVRAIPQNLQASVSMLNVNVCLRKTEQVWLVHTLSVMSCFKYRMYRIAECVAVLRLSL